MSQLIVQAGDITFQARFEEQPAPRACVAVRRAMPIESQAVHVRWSGEGVTLTSNLEDLPALGKTVPWKGAQKTRFEAT